MSDTGKPLRWSATPPESLYRRAHAVSRGAGHRHVGVEHALGALLCPEGPSVAFDVLTQLGATWEKWQACYPKLEGHDGDSNFNPAWYRLVGFAEGLALVARAEQVADEHVLLALAYLPASSDGDCLIRLGLNGALIVDALGRAGIPIPGLQPPAAPAARPPQGPRIYFPADECAGVVQALASRLRNRGGSWGFNRDNGGRYWVAGDADLEIEQIVRAVVRDSRTVMTEPPDDRAS